MHLCYVYMHYTLLHIPHICPYYSIIHMYYICSPYRITHVALYVHTFWCHNICCASTRARAETINIARQWHISVGHNLIVRNLSKAKRKLFLFTHFALCISCRVHTKTYHTAQHPTVRVRVFGVFSRYYWIHTMSVFTNKHTNMENPLKSWVQTQKIDTSRYIQPSIQSLNVCHSHTHLQFRWVLLDGALMLARQFLVLLQQRFAQFSSQQ